MELRGRTMRLGSRNTGLSELKVMVVLVALTGLGAPRLLAQAAAPLVLPHTITTIGGGATVGVKVGTAEVVSCSASVHDSIGNGCPANQASFGATSCITSG